MLARPHRCIDLKAAVEAERRDCRLRLSEDARGLCAYERVFAVGLLPNGRHVGAEVAGVQNCLELRLTLPAKRSPMPREYFSMGLNNCMSSSGL